MDEPSFYGFPTYGEAGPKAAQDVGGQAVDPDTRTFDRDEAAFERLRDFLVEHLPDAVGPPILTRTCLYTLTPDRDFVVDRLPDAPGVVVGLGAAHGFKYASVLGRILVELALDGSTPVGRGARRTSASTGRSCWRPTRRRPGWSEPPPGRPDADARTRRARMTGPFLAALSRGMPTFRALGRRLGGQARGWMSATRHVGRLRRRTRMRIARAPSAGPARRRRRPDRRAAHARRGPGRRAGGQDAAGRDDPGVRLDQPEPGRTWCRRTRRSSSTTTCWSASGPDLEYAPTGLATEWTQDGNTWTFKIREGVQWSDGTPFTARDVAFTYQYLLDSMDPAYTGPWAPDGNDVPGEGETEGDGAADNPLSLFGDFLLSTIELQSRRGRRRHDGHDDDRLPDLAHPRLVHPDPARAHLEGRHLRLRGDRLPDRPAGRRHRPLPDRRVAPRRVRALREEPELLGQAALPRRGHLPVLRQRGRDGPGPQGRHRRLHPGRHPRAVREPRRRPEHRRRERQRRGLDPARVQHLRQADRGRGRLDHGRP